MSVSSPVPELSPIPLKKPAVLSESVPLDEARWANWIAKNRLGDQRSAEQRRKWLTGVLAAVSIGTAVYWMR